MASALTEGEAGVDNEAPILPRGNNTHTHTHLIIHVDTGSSLSTVLTEAQF